MKKIMIDMDNVICEAGFLNVVNEFLGTNYKFEEIKVHYVQKLIPDERKQEWIEFFKGSNPYDNTVLIKDAYEVIEKLNKKYDVYVATSFIFEDDRIICENLIRDKIEYLHKNLPFIRSEQYIFIHNKELLNCEIKIDDSLSNLSGNAELKILFPAYHNRNVEKEELKTKGVVKVNGWKEIESILL